MPSILVNCHGGRPAGPITTFPVPVGVSVHFYCGDGMLLGNDVSWQILNNRLQFTPGPAPTQTFGPGTACPDYYGVPYVGLGVANGVQLQNGMRFDVILEGQLFNQWGPVTPNTITVSQAVLPSVLGGAAYARTVIILSNIANCPGITDVHWISCREIW
jgi:hypothetical protein